jgi:hypothetical protein
VGWHNSASFLYFAKFRMILSILNSCTFHAYLWVSRLKAKGYRNSNFQGKTLQFSESVDCQIVVPEFIDCFYFSYLTKPGNFSQRKKNWYSMNTISFEMKPTWLKSFPLTNVQIHDGLEDSGQDENKTDVLSFSLVARRTPIYWSWAYSVRGCDWIIYNVLGNFCFYIMF